MTQQQPVKKSHRTRWIVAGSAFGVFLLVMIIALATGNKSTPTGSVAPLAPYGGGTVSEQPMAPYTPLFTSEQPMPAPAPAPVPQSGPVTRFGEGQFEVGVDVVVGKYRSAGPITSSMDICYVEIDKDSSGDSNSIVSNDVTHGPKIITLKKGQFVKNQGCQDFVKTP